jgi:phosphocarrier protein
LLSGNDTRSDGEPAAEAEVRIPNRLGLHARPAAEFVKTSSRFDSAISVEKEGLEVNGKSIMGVMMLAAEFDSLLRIRAVGPDAMAAVSALSELVTSGFGEQQGDYGDPGDGEAARA